MNLRTRAAWSIPDKYSLLAALGLGSLLRLIGLESRSLSYDDTFSIFLARRSPGEILMGTAADTMPPLYYLLLHFWMIVCQQAWFIRLFSVLLSLAAVWLVYRIGERWLGRSAAGWSAFLAAISPLMIYHGQDVRMYALLVCAQLGYLWFFTLLWERDRDRRPSIFLLWVSLVACGTAAMYSHNIAVFALASPSLFLFLRRQWKMLARLAVAQLVIGLFALPWLVLVPAQIVKVQKAWTLPPPGVVEILQAVIMFTASLPLVVPLMALALLLSLQVFIMIGIELGRAWKAGSEHRAGIGFLLSVFGLPPVILFLASYIIKPVFIPRAFLVSSLAFDLLAGYIIASTWKRGVGKLLAGALVLAAAISLPTHYLYQEFPRSPYRQAANYLESVIAPGERVVHETKLSYFPAQFYAPELAQVFLADPPGSPNDTFEPGSQQAMQIFPQPNLETAAADLTGVYFITFHQTLSEYQQMGYDEHPNLAWLRNNFHQAGYRAFSDLDVYYFVR